MTTREDPAILRRVIMRAIQGRIAELEAQVERLQEIAADAYQLLSNILFRDADHPGPFDQQVEAMMDALAKVLTVPVEEGE